VRLRLTFLYGGLFLVSGAGIVAITYVFVNHRVNGPFHTGEGAPQGNLYPGTAAGSLHGSPPDSLQAQHSADLHQFLVGSTVALAVMALISIALGWLVAGRVLRPLRTMTVTTRQISERNLHERLALAGPDDELKDLSDTIDGLLARLEGAFDSQRRFVANASHELRTPLTLGRAMLQVALANPRTTLDQLRATCLDVIEAGKEQERLVGALLTLARSQRGLDHREPFDLAAVATEAVDAHRASAAAAGVSLDVTLHPAPIAGDARLVHTLASNLADNAVRYNLPGGHVQVAVAGYAGQALLTVTNTGPPIPDDQVERLLQPFQRFHGERGSDHDGLGLGLSIVAAIATAHGASLSVHPRSPGGLVVEVRFSLLATAASSPIEVTRRADTMLS